MRSCWPTAAAAGRWVDVRSDDINDYIKEGTGGEFTAKDFRTWHATVLAAVALAVSVPAARSERARKRAVARAVGEVSDYLGNTPAVCRTSYVDPRVVDRFNEGRTILAALDEVDGGAAPDELEEWEAVEEAVLDLLDGQIRREDPGSPGWRPPDATCARAPDSRAARPRLRRRCPSWPPRTSPATRRPHPRR